MSSVSSDRNPIARDRSPSLHSSEIEAVDPQTYENQPARPIVKAQKPIVGTNKNILELAAE